MKTLRIIASLAAAATLSLASPGTLSSAGVASAGVASAGVASASAASASAASTQMPPAAEIMSPVTTGDRAAMRTAVSLHLLAIQAANADAAFATIAPDTRMQFTSAQEFLAETTRVHGAVRSAREIIFDGIEAVGEFPAVRVYFRDETGQQWLARLGMSRIAANDWRIVSCSLTPAPGKLI